MPVILVIEDAKDLRDDVIEMLNLEGYDAYGAENGVVGVDMAHRLKPDIIVCDVMMPELDGYGVLDQIRKDADLSATPFIFLTAKSDRVNVRYGMVHGADDYLTKPFQVTELLDSIESQIAKRADLNQSAQRRMEELRENIITALPHELRTPLNTIIGFSDMLIMEAERLNPDQIVEWGQHINTAAHRLYRLVENYLYYVRITTAARMPETLADLRSMRTVHARTIIEAQIMRIAARAKREANLQLAIEDVSELAVSQPDLIKIVDELLDNALKFSDVDSVVEVGGTVHDGYFELCFQDHGRGMDSEHIIKIGAYMQFNRNMYEQQGMGLGLEIVKRLVDLYGGQFHIESTLGIGTRVCVTIPLGA